MFWKLFPWCCAVLAPLLLVWLAQPAAAADRLKEFQKLATRFNALTRLPQFEATPEAIWATVRRTMADGNAALDRLVALGTGTYTFANTVGALDDLAYENALVANRLVLLKETSPSADLRTSATEALKALQEWMVGLDYRDDVYQVLKAYTATGPKLDGEEAKLLTETLRDYRRAGLDLPRGRRDEIERQRKELTRLATDFESNITRATQPVTFTRGELDGVPEGFLEQTRTGADEWTVMAHVAWQYLMVMDNARNEATRRRLLIAHDNLARAENTPLLEQILCLRDDIACSLDYPSWADYQTEVKMVRNAATAIDFLEQLKTGLQGKFEAELEEFRLLKIRQTGDPAAKVHIWDWRYFSNQLKREKYAVDAEALRVYFPYQRVLEGMFNLYQRIFGLKFEPIEPPGKWVDDLQLYAVSDSQTDEPLGLFYLDMFPREGKFNHFAVFSLIEGKRTAEGCYQRPVCALVCNFPSPASGKPALLSHGDVETLFHEFGHAMHAVLTRANYGRFSGTNVPRDFVEAPSQMLEHWVWDKRVLDSFAADYRDPGKRIPEEILAKLKQARQGTEATRYRRQLSFGLTDLRLHTQIRRANGQHTLPLSSQTLSEVFLPLAPDTAFVASFGHLVGYDAGYYGYAWADAIAADMATVFERAPDGYFDEQAGRRLRQEIYEPGDSRDANLSIEQFLGRKRSLAPFFKKIGIGVDPQTAGLTRGT